MRSKRSLAASLLVVALMFALGALVAGWPQEAAADCACGPFDCEGAVSNLCQTDSILFPGQCALHGPGLRCPPSI